MIFFVVVSLWLISGITLGVGIIQLTRKSFDYVDKLVFRNIINRNDTITVAVAYSIVMAILTALVIIATIAVANIRVMYYNDQIPYLFSLFSGLIWAGGSLALRYNQQSHIWMFRLTRAIVGFILGFIIPIIVSSLYYFIF